jgi:hypothetical protein
MWRKSKVAGSSRSLLSFTSATNRRSHPMETRLLGQMLGIVLYGTYQISTTSEDANFAPIPLQGIHLFSALGLSVIIRQMGANAADTEGVDTSTKGRTMCSAKAGQRIVAGPRKCNSYSTVTLLARLRGWSTSLPLMTAVW